MQTPWLEQLAKHADKSPVYVIKMLLFNAIKSLFKAVFNIKGVWVDMGEVSVDEDKSTVKVAKFNPLFDIIFVLWDKVESICVVGNDDDVIIWVEVSIIGIIVELIDTTVSVVVVELQTETRNLKWFFTKLLTFLARYRYLDQTLTWIFLPLTFWFCHFLNLKWNWTSWKNKTI